MALCTVPKDKAKSLAQLLLKEKACACVNIIADVESFFWWEKKIDSAEESLLIIKAIEEKFAELEELIQKNHPYDVPEIIGFKIDKINKAYSSWLNDSGHSD